MRRATGRLVFPALLACLLPAVLVSHAAARITQLRLDTVEPFADGAPFGETGAYERVTGVARGELDPADPRNAGIAGLADAPRNAAGRVEYETDLFILRPADPTRGNKRLLFEVTNRGNKLMGLMLNRAPLAPAGTPNDPRTAADAGDALLLRHGYTLAWTGWDPDIAQANSNLSIRLPALTGQEAPVRDEFVSGTRGPPLERFRLSYRNPVASGAVLTVRRREADPPQSVPAESWRFADPRTVELLPAGTKPEPGSIYTLTYRARDPWVSGVAFASVRDVAARLRSERGLEGALGFGISLSGRFLRDFVARGFNADEDGKKVFDGVLTHAAGAGRVFLNQAFAQPSRTRTQHEDHGFPEVWFPFSSARAQDPATKQDGALLPSDAADPKMIEVNTSSEYWQKGASLLSTAPDGASDMAVPAGARLFLVAGTQHTGGTSAVAARGACANPRNTHSPAPALRALLAALDAWATRGTAPPDSRIPKVGNGTLVEAELLGFPALPGLTPAKLSNAVMPPGDWVRPADGPTPYRVLVPALDADGNERAGLMLPDMEVPLATYTGWNVYAAPFPDGELCDRDGSMLPFPLAETPGDPRPTLGTRYGSRDDYVERVSLAANRLVQDSLLLQEDADRYVAAAKALPPF